MGLNNLMGIMLLISTMLGYGIITLPCAFAKIGWIGGILILLISAIFSFISIYLLFKASANAVKKTKTDNSITFFQLFESISPILGDFCNLAIAFYIFFATVTYHKTLCDFASSFLEKFNIKIKRIFIAIIIAVIEFSLALLPDISSLSKVTYLSVTACMLVGILCIRFSILKPKGLIFETFNFDGISESLGSFIFALCGQSVIPEIFSAMDTSASPFIISIVGVIGGTLLCLLMGIAGYFTGGTILKECCDILNYFYITKTPLKNSIEKCSFDPKGYSILFATFLFFSLLICTYALLHFSAKRCLFDSFNRHITKYPKESKSYIISLIIISLLWVVSTTLISIFCYPTSLLNINGIYLGNTISFILPGIAYISHCGKKNKLFYILALLIILFGVGAISFFSVKNFIKLNK